MIFLKNKIFFTFILILFSYFVGEECRTAGYDKPRWSENIHVVMEWPNSADSKSRLRLEEYLTKFFENSIYQIDQFLPPSVKEMLDDEKLTIEVQLKNAQGASFQGGKNASKITVNINSLLQNDGQSLFFHEFFHFIHYLYRPQEESWLKEGMAMLFEYYLTKHIHWKAAKAFRENSQRPLVVPYDPFKPNLADYGQSFFFLYYIQNKCGAIPLLWKLTQSTEEAKGIDFVQSLLEQYPTCQDFYSTHCNFLIARSHNKMSFIGEKFSSRYQLFHTTSPLAPIFSLLSSNLSEKKLKDKLSSLFPGTSLLVKDLRQTSTPYNTVQNIKSLFPHLELLFLEKHFPYKVLTQPPSSLQDFHILFLYPYGPSCLAML